MKKFISLLAFILPSLITRIVFRLIGHKIGENTKLPIFSYIYAQKMDIGNDAEIRSLVFINVGELFIGNNAIVSYGVQIKGDKKFTIGDNSFIGPHCLINCDEDVRLGFYSGLGPRCTVYTHGSFLPVTHGYPAKFDKVIIDDYVWTAMDVVIMAGTHIESNCIINPGIVLKSRIRANSIIEANPSSVQIKSLSRLQKFLKKDNIYYYRQIFNEFLISYNLRHEYNESEASYIINDTYLFKCFPEKNRIELQYGNGKKINYDLDNYYADYCKLKIHRNFLFFLRRRYGLTLRTKY